MRSLSIDRARRIVLGAQGLTTARPSGRVDVRHLRRMFRSIGVLQIDSVNVIERAHHLTSFARLGDHERDLPWDAMGNRELFEYWGHEASFLPVETWPLWRHRMDRMGDWQRVRELKEREPEYIDAVLDQVARVGPLTASDLEDSGDRRGPWWGWPKGKVALEYLFARGRVTVSERRNFTRYYDLSERVIPAEHFHVEPVPRHDAQRRLTMMAARSLGLGTAADLVDYYRLPKQEGRRVVLDLAAEGALVEVEVEGWRHPAFLHPEATVPRIADQARLLCPFDNLVFFRDRVERLFDFHYRIEIYVPKPKRRYGYYVLPFLRGDRLVARVDVKADRQAGVLRVPGAFLEDGQDAPSVARSLSEELMLMASWLGLGDIRVGRRGDLAPALRRNMGA